MTDIAACNTRAPPRILPAALVFVLGLRAGATEGAEEANVTQVDSPKALYPTHVPAQSGKFVSIPAH